MKVGLISRTDYKDALSVAKDVAQRLLEYKVNVIVETDTSMALGINQKTADLSDLDGDFIITVGGDGTILRAAMEIKDPSTPLLGINMGRRGFLAEVHKEEVGLAIERLLSEDYQIQECLKVRSKNMQMQDIYSDALNEVLVASSLPSKMILFSIDINGERITDIQADGCLVSTPTGSTAYNLSAGGSIIAPEVDSLVITAICPYSYFKSIVLPPDSKVTVKLLKPRTEAMAIIDGRAYNALKPLSTVKVWASPNKARFIRFNSFYSRLKRRLAFLQSQ